MLFPNWTATRKGNCMKHLNTDPTDHRASPLTDLDWQVGQVKPPLSMFERVSLMVACYVVIFAGIMLIFSIIDLYMFLDRVSQALESWGNRLDVS